MIWYDDFTRFLKILCNKIYSDELSAQNEFTSHLLILLYVNKHWPTITRSHPPLPPWLGDPHFVFHFSHLDLIASDESQEYQSSSHSPWGCNCHLCSPGTGCYFYDRTERTREMRAALVFAHSWNSLQTLSHQLEMILKIETLVYNKWLY